MRFRIELTIMGQNFSLLKVLDGNKGWEKLNDEATP